MWVIKMELKLIAEALTPAKVISVLLNEEEALDALEADHDYLTAGGVFPEHLIQNLILWKYGIN